MFPEKPYPAKVFIADFTDHTLKIIPSSIGADCYRISVTISNETHVLYNSYKSIQRIDLPSQILPYNPGRKRLYDNDMVLVKMYLNEGYTIDVEMFGHTLYRYRRTGNQLECTEVPLYSNTFFSNWDDWLAYYTFQHQSNTMVILSTKYESEEFALESKL